MRRRTKIAIIALGIGVAMLAAVVIMPNRYKAYISKIIDKIESVLFEKPATYKDKTNYSALFNDLNPTHLSAAKKLGLKRPLKDRAEAEGATQNLVKISSNKHYTVDELTHSIPYLTEGAAELVETIGREFMFALEKQGYRKSKIIVTSVLRTQEDIGKLQKSGNVNASSNSAHCYATTFDITYARFDKSSSALGLRHKSADNNRLKKILGDVLLELHKQNKCFVKYEVNQHCFHITTRV